MKYTGPMSAIGRKRTEAKQGLRVYSTEKYENTFKKIINKLHWMVRYET